MGVKETLTKWIQYPVSKRSRIGWWIGKFFALLVITAICWGLVTVHALDQQRVGTDPEIDKKSPIAIDKKRDYGESGFQQVAESEHLILSADFTTGEINVQQKCNGYTWYSNPQSRNDEGIKGRKGQLASQLVLTYANSQTAASTTADSNTQSVKNGGMDHELIENGVKFIFSFPTSGIIVPLEYTLEGNSLKVSIPADGIQETWNKFYAMNVDVLPFFGASTVEDEGYMFVPDGSGALIELNSSNYTLAQYMGNIYNIDPALGDIRMDNQIKTVSLPVFGMRVNGNAFLSVVESGAANSRIYSYLSRKLTSYNQLYTQATLRTVQLQAFGGAGMNAGAEEEAKVAEDWSDCLLAGTDYTLKYFFLPAEEADYVGMSNCYREYLRTQEGYRESPLVDKQYLILDVYGAASIEKYVMGVKQYVVTPLTTYNQVTELARDLKNRGVENLIINYIGALQGGMEREMIREVKIEPVLGTRKEFDRMLAAMKEMNILFFIENDPVRLRVDGNGYSRAGSCVQTYFNNLATKSQFSINLYPLYDYGTVKDTAYGLKTYFLHHELSAGLAREFVRSAGNAGIQGVSLSAVGSTLYSDFRDPFVSRTRNMVMWQEVLSDAQQQIGYLMVHGGNAYALPYVDVVTDVPVVDSGYDCVLDSVPFYQLALRHNVVIGMEPINVNADYQYMILKAIETGANLKYNVMAADATKLVGTEYNDMVSYAFDNWLDTIVDSYHRMQATTGQVACERITAHGQVAPGLYRTEYQSGSVVLVNYNDERMTWEGATVEARGCALVKEGEQ